MVLIAALFLFAVQINGSSSADTTSISGGYEFTEDFVWSGNHAATVANGAATTVWWDEDDWDVRADTSFNNIYGLGSDGHHMDIHKANADPRDGTRVNNTYAVGGDGGPGVGVLHIDGEEIASSRLRNPMLISASNPGVVEFNASNFVTTGHWWEVIITPADGTVNSAAFTAVPDTGDTFQDNPGAGHRPALDSINMITIGISDVPCQTGWGLKSGFTRIVNGASTDFIGPNITEGTSPAEQNKLYRWRVEYYPDEIKTFVDLDEDGVPEHLRSYPVNVPWDEVYVHFAGVAYQTSHHPQDSGCGAYQGTKREFPWKNIEVSPVKYETTASFPKNDGANKVIQNTGWTAYDLRDDQRVGGPVNGVPQPNDARYSQWNSVNLCTGGWWCGNAISSKTLSVEIPTSSASGITRAQLIYDIRDSGGATLKSVNGVNLDKPLVPATSVPARTQETHWVQRSVDFDPSLIQSGSNSITVNLSGTVALDRLHFEFAYGEASGDGEPQPQAPSMSVSSPASGETVEGGSVEAQYTLDGDTSDVSGAYFEIDGVYSGIDTDLDGSYMLEGVPAGDHQLIGYLVDSAEAEIDGTRKTVSFSVADASPDLPKVLVFHKVDPNGGYHHDSNQPGADAIRELGALHGFDVDDTMDSAVFYDSSLAQYDAVVFLSTHQNVLDDAEQAAFERYIQAGNGFAGIHLASGTEYQWSWYGNLVGARFNNHPEVQTATVVIEDDSHPSTAGLPALWEVRDEWYNFMNNNFSALAPDRSKVRVLATVDESTYNPSLGINPGAEHGDDHPVTWCQLYDGGRSWYTNMGHFTSQFADPNYRSHILGGILWAAGLEEGDCSPSGALPANADPDAAFSASVESGDAPLTVQFDASASSDSDGSIASYAWDFGDGSSGSGETVSHTFNGAGSYDVVLTVTDDDGATDTHSVTIVVSEVEEAVVTLVIESGSVEMGGTTSVDVVLSAAPDGVSGLSVTLVSSDADVARIVDASSSMTMLQKEIDPSGASATIGVLDATHIVGDGAQNVTLFTLEIEGGTEGIAVLSIVALNMDDDGGFDLVPDLVNGEVEVPNEAPSVSVGGNVEVEFGGTLAQEVAISDTGDDGWTVSVDYGDGFSEEFEVSSATFTIDHVYDSAGDFTVTVTVTDDNGASDVGSFEVHVPTPFPTLPGMSAPAGDLDGDGKAEDVNGNGRLDFADIVTLFVFLDSTEVESNPQFFDFNDNGQVDLADLVMLFGMLVNG